MLDRDAPTALKEDGCPRMGPDHDSPKAPPDKARHKAPPSKDCGKDDVMDMNDGELKGLLDEALHYKNPPDRECMSKLFNNLLNVAEEDERNARAARAGGSEQVRYCNPAAKRGSRHRKKPTSISENMMHGGSLDNVANEDLYELSKHTTRKSVSARQREGGSLPCNVNASAVTKFECRQFLEEAKRKKETVEQSVFVGGRQMQEHQQEAAPSIEMMTYPIQPTKYTSLATLQVNNVDDPIQLSHLEQSSTVDTKSSKPYLGNSSVVVDKSSQLFVSPGTYHLSITNKSLDVTKKVDENGNALQQGSGEKTQLLKSKKKKPLDKNVVVCNAENVEGHRSDIIDNMDELMRFITNDKSVGADRSTRPIKSKHSQLNRNASDDTKPKKRSHPGKTQKTKLKKCNSLGEISTTEFDFGQDRNEEGEIIRDKSEGAVGRGERRSWGNVEPAPQLSSNEHLESAEFRVVTKKKKSKKRRSSVNGRAKSDLDKGGSGRVERSPDRRRKSVCSVPHSDKSNDSSDGDSVHSLPIDTRRPVSYADMARTHERMGAKRLEKVMVVVPKDEVVNNNNNFICDAGEGLIHNNNNNNNIKTPPDVHNTKYFPAITRQVTSECVSANKKIPMKNHLRNNVAKCVGNTDVHNNNGLIDFGMYSCALPPDIPDVQTIEKLQLMGQGYDPSASTTSTPTHLNVLCGVVGVDCDKSERTVPLEDERPPVVILSGNGKEVPGLVFGFDINEQLLSGEDGVMMERRQCEEFAARYIAPQTYTATSHNHEKIVNFVGSAWEDAIMNLENGTVQYYSQ